MVCQSCKNTQTLLAWCTISPNPTKMEIKNFGRDSIQINNSKRQPAHFSQNFTCTLPTHKILAKQKKQQTKETSMFVC